MTVYPLPEPINSEKKEKLLDCIVVPTAVISGNKDGYTPVSVAAATVSRTQLRLRSFRILIIVLMILGLVIIAATLTRVIYQEMRGSNSKSHKQIQGVVNNGESKMVVKEDVEVADTFVTIVSMSMTYKHKQFESSRTVISNEIIKIYDDKINVCYLKSGINFSLDFITREQHTKDLQIVEKSYLAKEVNQTEIKNTYPDELKISSSYIYYVLTLDFNSVSNNRKKRGANCIVKLYDAGFFPIDHKNTLQLDEIRICK